MAQRFVCKIAVCLIVGLVLFGLPQRAAAQIPPCACGTPPFPDTPILKSGTCQIADCVTVGLPGANPFSLEHAQGENQIRQDFEGATNDYKGWLEDDFAKGLVVPALKAMAEQLSMVALQQVQIVGTFFDAKAQLETQGTLQELEAAAQRDYYPSEDFCYFGTNVRSLAASEEKARYNVTALNRYQMARQLGQGTLAARTGTEGDKKARWQQFTQRYCDPQDNNWRASDDGVKGLASICEAPDTNRVNADINYTRMIELSRSLDMDFTVAESMDDPQESEAIFDRDDVLALSHNLYGHDVLSRGLDLSDYFQKSPSERDSLRDLYMGLRTVAAKRNVAQNSFNAIVGMKSYGAKDAAKTREFLGAILKEVGVGDTEIFEYLGQNPSYYAQLEALSKTIYQNPDFYANLYDTPANVDRKRAAMKAIGLMLDRAIYESQLRREMATSVFLATKIEREMQDE